MYYCSQKFSPKKDYTVVGPMVKSSFTISNLTNTSELVNPVETFYNCSSKAKLNKEWLTDYTFKNFSKDFAVGIGPD